MGIVCIDEHCIAAALATDLFLEALSMMKLCGVVSMGAGGLGEGKGSWVFGCLCRCYLDISLIVKHGIVGWFKRRLIHNWTYIAAMNISLFYDTLSMSLCG